MFVVLLSFSQDVRYQGIDVYIFVYVGSKLARGAHIFEEDGDDGDKMLSHNCCPDGFQNQRYGRCSKIDHGLTKQIDVILLQERRIVQDPSQDGSRNPKSMEMSE